MDARGPLKTQQTLSFIDFKNEVSELAVHAESKMIILRVDRCKVSLFQVSFANSRQGGGED